MTKLHAGEQPSNAEVLDPVHLQGDELYDYIVKNGLAHVVSADNLGAFFVDDVTDRLGPRFYDITVSFTPDPDHAEHLVVNFLPRIDRR